MPSDYSLEALEDKNTNLREQLSEMETEFKYLKKLMMEAGLGSYAAAVKYSIYYLCVILAQSVTFILSRKLIIHDDIGF